MPQVITKRICEWAELSRRLHSALRKGLRLRNDWDKRAFEILRRRASNDAVGKLSKRLWAVGTHTSIQLHYVRTSRATGLMEATLAATVYPASGGRTQYRIPNCVNGWCANKYLPMGARDRETGNSSRTHWYFGGSGVWRRGMGDYYPDAGPRCCNEMLADVVAALASKEAKPPLAWRLRAARFTRSLVRAVRPFADVVVRYEMVGISSAARRPLLVSGHADAVCSPLSIRAEYGIRVRLKAPSRGQQLTPDFCAIASGPFMAIDGGPATWFAVEMLAPHGLHSHDVASRDGSQSAWTITLKSSRVVELAREWAAANVRIPIA
jgi:hypothetical protein